MKKIFLLLLVDDDLKSYDSYWGHVVVADNKEEARKLVDESSNGDEKGYGQEDCWLNPKYSSCEELSLEQSCIVLSDFHAG